MNGESGLVKDLRRGLGWETLRRRCVLRVCREVGAISSGFVERTVMGRGLVMTWLSFVVANPRCRVSHVGCRCESRTPRHVSSIINASQQCIIIIARERALDSELSWCAVGSYGRTGWHPNGECNPISSDSPPSERTFNIQISLETSESARDEEHEVD
jgi:hypothetical protein